METLPPDRDQEPQAQEETPALPPEKKLPPPPGPTAPWTVFRVVALLLPLLWLTGLSLFAAVQSLFALLSGQLGGLAPTLLYAALAAGLGWLSRRSARKTWRIHRGWERPSAPGLLMNLGVIAAVLGLLAAIAIPRFAELTRSGHEGGTRGNLGAIRSTLSIYYGDLEGLYPADPRSLTINRKYMTELPKAKMPPYHRRSAEFLLGAAPDDAGGWVYNNEPTDANFGSIFINCTHTDTRGKAWTSY